MALTLTPLASDNFQRANVKPLASPWVVDEFGDPSLQIVSDLCETTTNSQNFCAQIYNYAGGTPNDQYASLTVGVSGDVAGYYLFLRVTDNGDSLSFGGGNSAYAFWINNVNNWRIFDVQSGTVLASGNLAYSAGDVFIFAVVGATLYLQHNGSQIASVTSSAHSSGSTALGIVDGAGSGPGKVTNFVMGGAALSQGVSNGLMMMGCGR